MLNKNVFVYANFKTFQFSFMAINYHLKHVIKKYNIYFVRNVET